MATDNPPSDFVGQVTTAASSFFSLMKVTILASSGIAALLSGLLYFKQNELIYPRNIPAGSREEVFRPRKFGFHDYEELLIPTPDGETLGAFLLRPGNQSQSRNVTILMFHGNAGNIGHRVPIAIKLQEDLGCSVFMLEYRGYGFSTGTPDEHGLLIDGQTALDYIRNRADLKDTKIIVYGQSLGGAVSVPLVANNQEEGKIAGLILENTFTSMRKMIPSAFPPAKYLARLCHQVWPSETTLPKIAKTPILFMSGLKDEIVPPSHMKQLYAICRSKRKVWKDFPNGRHNESILEPGYFETIAEFVIDEVLAKGEAPAKETSFGKDTATTLPRIKSNETEKSLGNGKAVETDEAPEHNRASETGKASNQEESPGKSP